MTKPTTPLPAFAEGCIDDINALPTVTLRRIALLLLSEVVQGRRAGRPLGVRLPTGDLSDCFKVYFDEVRDIKPRYRIVYREFDDGSVLGVRVEAVAVGRRDALSVYFEAARRLGRLPEQQ